MVQSFYGGPCRRCVNVAGAFMSTAVAKMVGTELSILE